MDEYRNPLAGLRAQIEGKKVAVRDQSRRIPAIVRALVPTRIGDVLAREPEVLAREAADLEAAIGLDAALEELLVAQGDALTLGPTLRACPEEVPRFPPPGSPQPFLLEEDSFRRFREHTESLLAAYDAEARLERWGDFGYAASFQSYGSPLRFFTEGFEADRTLHLVTSFASRLRTSVAPKLPPLHVKLEGPHHMLGRMLHVVSEEVVGDPPFDEAYWVQGALASVLLDATVRRALLWMRRAAPVLTLEDGMLELVWHAGYPSDLVLPGAAMTVVTGIRAAIERA